MDDTDQLRYENVAKFLIGYINIVKILLEKLCLAIHGTFPPILAKFIKKVKS